MTSDYRVSPIKKSRPAMSK
ncbi:hypothetical protein WAJ24_20225 [Acinetobacter baumannii]|uniref:Protein YicU n=1 Tax=Escherichia coli (strain K12) TaxID=83333 RepID=YICU_ECOLI|nr:MULTISPECIES: protein YicU [Gammaproteobacteria]YP_010051211.1 protein YicU [Escherichia coli str. K-12 substr. MG1655]P0DSH5.1 RecName: Full=Protein YicU [Escherichia coli K-12]QNV50551.1 protein YicU [Escherichia coli str. K-12 substr. MG1655]